jgi:serine/threonine protein kinase
MNTNLCNLCGSPLRAVDGLCPACVARTITSFIKKPAVTDEMPDVPGYEILGVIGRGGMGVVFRALRLDDELEVALKIGSAELFERLQREADTLRQLDHPHILRMLDSGLTPDGRCFIVTPLIQGGDLAKRLQQGPLPEKEALRLFRQVLSAVAYAHEKGVVHRDIKPANLLLNEANNIVVADFSLAKPGEPEIALTQTAEVLGTPYYIAPEVRRRSIIGRTSFRSACCCMKCSPGSCPSASMSLRDTIAWCRDACRRTRTSVLLASRQSRRL